MRIGSFASWSDTISHSPLLLAKNGFYYNPVNGGGDDERGDPDDTVTCFSCNATFKGWHGMDVCRPVKQHAEEGRECVFLGENGKGNVPLSTPSDLSLRHAYAKAKGEPAASPPSPPPPSSSAPPPPSVHKPRPLVQHPLPVTTTTKSNDPVQQAIDRVPSTYKLSHPNPQPKSTDPRKRADFTFLDRMRSEKERKNTFYDWPEGAWQTPSVLAEAGFFYTGSVDRCQCAFCRGLLRNWEPNDVPIQEHAKHFRECPFVNGKYVGNVPLPVPPRESHSTHAPVDLALGNATATPIAEPYVDPGMGIMTQRPKNPDYAIEVTRVSTFNHPGWPRDKQQAPGLLAKAGFYYAGFADNVKCFFCDGGLRNWEPDDDPWIQHANWFPRCPFLRMTKGDQFVRDVRADRVESAVANTPSGLTYRVEPKEIKARMDTDLVKRVVAMGYPADLIRKVIEERMRTTGDDFETIPNMLEAVFRMEDECTAATALAATNGFAVAKEKERQRVQAMAREEQRKIAALDEQLERESRAAAAAAATNSTLQLSGPAEAGSKKKKKKKKKNSKKTTSSPTTTTSGEEAGLSPLSKEYQELVQQNQDLRDQRICKVCMDNNVNLVFLPCSHLVCCTKCAPALRTCPICRKMIKGTVRIFLS